MIMKKILLFVLLTTILFNTIYSQSETIIKSYNMDTKILLELTKKWNELMISQDFDSLKEMYSTDVIYYGVELTCEDVITKKTDFIEKYTDFSQDITEEIDIFKINDDKYKITFPKTTTFNNKTFDVYGVLYFELVADNWKIISESDGDTNYAYGDKCKEFKNCIEVVDEIISTSPLFNKILEDNWENVVVKGGNSIGFILVGSPNEADNVWGYSEKYDYKICTFANNMTFTISYFSFDPSTLELYAYGEKIDYHQYLKKEFIRLCK